MTWVNAITYTPKTIPGWSSQLIDMKSLALLLATALLTASIPDAGSAGVKVDTPPAKQQGVVARAYSGGVEPGQGDLPQSDDEAVAMPDCLGDVAADGTITCVDPTTGRITANGPDGTLVWSADLDVTGIPGKIEALALVASTPWLIAHANEQTGCARTGGSHCANAFMVMPIDPDNVAQSYQWLFTGSGGFATDTGSLKYDYNLGGNDLLAIGIGDYLYAAIEVHELIPDADRSQPDSWQFHGTSVTRFGPNLVHDMRRATRLYPQRVVRSLARTRHGDLIVQFDAGSERLDATTLAPISPGPAQPRFADSLPDVVVPALMAPARAAVIDQITAQIGMLRDQVRETASELITLASDVPVPRPAGNVDQNWMEDTVHVCAMGGRLSSERTFRRAGLQEHLLERFHYEDCRFEFSSTGIDSPGEYRIDGTHEFERTVHHGSVLHDEWRDTLYALVVASTDGRSTRTSATQSWSLAETQGGTSMERATLIERHEVQTGTAETMVIRNARISERARHLLGHRDSSFEGQWTLEGVAPEGHSVSVNMEPAFERTLIDTANSGEPARWDFSGYLRADASDGSVLTIDVLRDPTPVIDATSSLREEENALVEITVSDVSETTIDTRISHALLIPISVFQDVEKSRFP